MKLSIVTINYNDKSGLHKTMESVVNQTYPDIEYIVIDGGSTDGSVDVIKYYETKIAYWISERDKGIYNAMNKGLKQATGDYCLFLNSGDFLRETDVIERVLKKEISQDIVSCGLELFNNKKSWYQIPPNKISFYSLIDSSLPHPSTFIKRTLFDAIGTYNEDYKIISDWCFFVDALLLHKASYATLNIVVSKFNCFGVSSTHSNELNEKRDFLLNRFPVILSDFEYFVLQKESYLNVIYWLRSHRYLNNILEFPFKILNSFLKLRRKYKLKPQVRK